MCSEIMQWSILFQFDTKGRFWLGSHGIGACICVPVRVTIIYHANQAVIPKNSIYHPFKHKMCSEIMQWSILFQFNAKGRFWSGTHSAHAYICIPVRVTLIYHANQPVIVIGKICIYHPFKQQNVFRNNAMVNFVLV